VSEHDAGIDTVSLLAEPVRRALYRFVADAPAEVGRDEAAAAVGVSRSLAAFHLDKLVGAGLLATSYRRISGRSGPGAGRPAKLYRRAEGEHAVSLPPRAYAAAAHLLAEVADEAGLEPQLQAAARRAGAGAAAAATARARARAPAARADGADPGGTEIVEVLAERGYQPRREGAAIRLRNCPFHTLAREFPPLVCGMNLALLEGLLAGGAAGRDWEARMDPRPGECCVALVSKDKSG
jgi:predicted ArsR family transcriptional regulator